MNNQRIVLIIIAALSIFTIGYLLITAINRADKTKIELSSFPDDASITFDGQKVANGTRYLEPGTYQLEAKKDGFEDYAKTVVITEEEQTIAIVLIPVSDEAREWTKKNQSKQEDIQADIEKAVYESGKRFNELNPITRHLPYKTFFFSIGYRMDQSDPSGNSIIIEIDAPEGYRQSALYKIRQLGYDPTDFTINFRNYENPFPL